MAVLSQGGGYVKLSVNVWYDKKGKNVHVTSNDKDLPENHMHMTAKKGTQSDANLRALLDKFDCGPAAAEAEALGDFNKLLLEIEAGEWDDQLTAFEDAILQRKDPH
jgi:hypothetical protein